MKKVSTLANIIGFLAFALLAYAGVEYRSELLMFLKKNFSRDTRATEGVTPAAPLNRLPEQIALCRKKGPGFQACMFDSGYAVNSAWSDAHKAAGAGPSPAQARDVVQDPYRAEPSLAYGVPYWIPRPPK